MNLQTKFDEWNNVKKAISEQKSKKQLSIKEIHWIHIGQNVGSEVYGKGKDFVRPVLVLSIFHNFTFLGVPLTSKTQRKRGKSYYKFTDSKGRIQVALLGQMRIFDIRRKINYISKISDENFTELKEKIKNEIIK